VFSYLDADDLWFEAKVPGSSFVLAFRTLPLVLVISAMTALPYYWRILLELARVSLDYWST